MKITINQSLSIPETEVIINCSSMNQRLQHLVAHLQQYTLMIQGSIGEEIFHVPSEQIYYIESVDGKTYFYDTDKTYDSRESLGSFEKKLKNTPFVRISKNCILNTSYLRSVKPFVNHRLEATLTNGEKVIIARNYIEEVKEKIRQ